ncbi:hypothetical protein [Photobacterium leiognathi]|uniref:hypothetical protein n=1 Tax=Photobacterium leiognathi TaxID=553611 RepID=UPI002982706B|nr:hypothetical protein [Photobacterium leiognathi]
MNLTLINTQRNIQSDVQKACKNISDAINRINSAINIMEYTSNQNTHNADQIANAKTVLQGQIQQLKDAESQLLKVEELEIEVNKII